MGKMTIKGIAELFDSTIKKIQEIISYLGLVSIVYTQDIAGKEYATELYTDEDIEKIGKELHTIKDEDLSDFNKKLKQGLGFNPKK